MRSAGTFLFGGRLHAVLSVVCLIYNTGADDPGRAELRREAIRLARPGPDPLGPHAHRRGARDRAPLRPA